MSESYGEEHKAPSSGARGPLQVAEIDLAAGRATFRARVQVTPAGLLSIGALVSSILISTSLLVWTSVSAARRRPPERTPR